MSCSKFASASRQQSGKDLNFDLDLEDLSKVQRIDENRSSKLRVNEELNSVGKMNYQRAWKRSHAEYMDSRYPGEVMQYVDSIPVKGLPGGKSKKPKKSQYVRKTERKELPPVENIRCCTKNCLQEHVPKHYLQEMRDEYLALPNLRAKREYLREYLEAETNNFSAHGQHLTWEAMNALFGASRTMLQTTKQTRRAEHTGEKYRNHSIKGYQVLLDKRTHIIAFLKCISSEFESAPNSAEVFIPHAFQRTLYRTFLEYWMQEVEGGVGGVPVAPPHETYFLRIWKEHVPWLKCRAYNTFLLCDECVSLNDRLRIAKTSAEKNAIWEEKRIHLFMVREERCEYTQRIILAKRHPDLYLLMTIDGSDNSSYGFPYFACAEKDHASSKGYKVRSKLYASILHGHFGTVFTYAANLVGGSNVTIEIIHKTLQKYLNDKPGNKLPPTLWIQLDNTAKDNKNRYVFSYCHSLVDMGLFQEVEVNFLPVGHTHCDIDQLFSRISVHLYGNNCFNFKDLLRKARKACSLIKYVERLYGFANWKEHMLHHEYIETGGGFAKFAGHRQFRFVRHEYRGAGGVLEGFSTVFQARKTIFHKYWCDLKGNIGGHIPLALVPLTYENVFDVDRKSLDYTAYKVERSGEKDAIAEMIRSVNNSERRLVELLGEEKGQLIKNGLLAEIELQKEDQEVSFNWDLSFYQNPPVNWTDEEPYVARDCVPQSGDDIDDVREEASAVVDLEDAGGLINSDLKLTNIGDYVIVKPNVSADSLKRPFWVGHVCKNSKSKEKIQVHWLLPPTSISVRQGKATGTYEQIVDPDLPENESGAEKKSPALGVNSYKTPRRVPIERQHKPQRPNKQCVLKHYPYAEFRPVLQLEDATKVGERRYKKKTVWISYDCVFFSFPHLGEEDTLPGTVLDAISNEPQIDWMG